MLDDADMVAGELVPLDNADMVAGGVGTKRKRAQESGRKLAGLGSSSSARGISTKETLVEHKQKLLGF